MVITDGQGVFERTETELRQERAEVSFQVQEEQL